MQKADIIIVGAGMVGASCALGLAANSDLSVILLDSSTEAKLDPANVNTRVSALSQSSVQCLESLGVWQNIAKHGCEPYHNMYIWDEMNDAELQFDASEVGKQQLGYIVDNGSLVYALQQAVGCQKNIRCMYAEEAVKLEQSKDGVVLHLASEQKVSSNLLIAADGANSWVRQALGVPTQNFEYQQQAIVAKIALQYSHKSTAWQRYLSSGPVAVLPVSGDKEHVNQASIVWSAQIKRAEELQSLSDADFERELQYALENRLGEIKLLSPRSKFPLQSVISNHYVDGSVVLVGDAAHRIHPMAGQGVNLGFKDVTVLQDEVLSAYHQYQNVARRNNLRRYERQRKLDNQLTDQAMTALHHLFGISNPSMAMLRGMGIKALNRSLAVKNQLAMQAMGI